MDEKQTNKTMDEEKQGKTNKQQRKTEKRKVKSGLGGGEGRGVGEVLEDLGVRSKDFGLYPQ